jgi:hypothetical protein
MRVIKITLEALQRFAYCSMMYRFRDHLKLPTFAPTLEVAYQYAIHSGFSTYFHEEVTRTMDKRPPKHSMERAITAYRTSMARAQKAFPGKAGTWATMFGEGLMSLRAFTDQYDPTRDYPLAYDVPFTVNTTVADTQFSIQGSIDFLYFRANRTPDETAVAVILINTADPIQDLSGLSDLRRGFIYRALRDPQVVPKNVPVELLEITVMREKPVAVFQPDGKNFDVFLDNVLKGVASGMSIPSADPEKCTHCPYVAICRPSMAAVDLDSLEHAALVAKVRDAGKKKPYYKELIR